MSSESAAEPRAETTTYVFEREKEKPSKAETIIEERVSHVPMSEAPRSVREWDTLKVEEVDRFSKRSVSPAPTRKTSKSHHSHHTRSRSHVTKSRRSSSPSDIDEIIEKRTEIREISPSRTLRTSRSRRRSSPVEVVERREIVEDIGESNSVHAGPLALVVGNRKSDREIEYEIRQLERERRALRAERHTHDRIRTGEREVIIERESPDVIEVKKDKKGRMSLVVPR